MESKLNFVVMLLIGLGYFTMSISSIFGIGYGVFLAGRTATLGAAFIGGGIAFVTIFAGGALIMLFGVLLKGD